MSLTNRAAREDVLFLVLVLFCAAAVAVAKERSSIFFSRQRASDAYY